MSDDITQYCFPNVGFEGLKYRARVCPHPSNLPVSGRIQVGHHEVLGGVRMYLINP